MKFGEILKQIFLKHIPLKLFALVLAAACVIIINLGL